MQIDFYVDVEEARRASRDRTSFNAIHFETSMRVDFFVAEGTSLSAEQLSRRRTIDTPAGPVTFYAPEDLVIRKLLWYRSGGGQSERQWRDVVRVLAVSGPQLDVEYLERTAAALSLADLLSGALEEARA